MLPMPCLSGHLPLGGGRSAHQAPDSVHPSGTKPQAAITVMATAAGSRNRCWSLHQRFCAGARLPLLSPPLRVRRPPTNATVRAYPRRCCAHAHSPILACFAIPSHPSNPTHHTPNHPISPHLHHPILPDPTPPSPLSPPTISHPSANSSTNGHRSSCCTVAPPPSSMSRLQRSAMWDLAGGLSPPRSGRQT
jgi:hypothetical protein